MTTIIRSVLAALVLALAVTTVKAEERIPFVEGGLKGNDWVFFKEYLKVNHPLIIKYVAEIRGLIPSSIEGDSFRGFPNGKKSESMRRTDTEVRYGQSGCVTGRF